LNPDRGRVKRVDRAGIAGIDPEPRAPFVIGARFEGFSPSDFLHDSSNGCRGSTPRSAATAFFRLERSPWFTHDRRSSPVAHNV